MQTQFHKMEIALLKASGMGYFGTIRNFIKTQPCKAVLIVIYSIGLEGVWKLYQEPHQYQHESHGQSCGSSDCVHSIVQILQTAKEKSWCLSALLWRKRENGVTTVLNRQHLSGSINYFLEPNTYSEISPVCQPPGKSRFLFSSEINPVERGNFKK